MEHKMYYTFFKRVLDDKNIHWKIVRHVANNKRYILALVFRGLDWTDIRTIKEI